MARAVPMDVNAFEQYFSYMPGMLGLFTLPGHYIQHWIETFYATAFVSRDRSQILYMFEGQRYTLNRSCIVATLGLQEYDVLLHKNTYPRVRRSRRPVNSGVITPDHEIAKICFQEPFGPASPRSQSDLTPLAAIILEGLRRSLLPRTRNPGTLTALQQWLLSYMLMKEPFDIVDFLICEIEDVIAEGLTVGRRFPYAHIISYILARTHAPFERYIKQWSSSPTSFPDYRPALPDDRRRRGQRAPKQQELFRDEDEALHQDEEVQGGEDEALRQDEEVQGGLEDILASEDLSEDDLSDPDFVIPHAHDDDDEASGSASQAQPTVSDLAAKVESLEELLKNLTKRQQEHGDQVESLEEHLKNVNNTVGHIEKASAGTW